MTLEFNVEETPSPSIFSIVYLTFLTADFLGRFARLRAGLDDSKSQFFPMCLVLPVYEMFP